ncbi:hypothetical protein BS47DRAFT_1368519 [Hydnum rufescens UP504]|uniref:Uncharacterized protein n=1 Tax=Hydnum rufescens UP504 TaxID=1448309 RepID=A0A9P6AGJ2_9AGAM|nr:hypothetical protein BS47DRAFT_1368519 [Hydnum rufescens UP504]
MGMDTILSEGFPSQYGLLHIQQTMGDLLSWYLTWQHKYLDAVQQAVEAPPECRVKPWWCLKWGWKTGFNLVEFAWEIVMKARVGELKTGWISRFGGHSDLELSDVEDMGLGTLLAEDVLAEHRRQIAANDKNWIEVFGSLTGVELSEDEGKGMEDGEKLILHQLADSMGSFFFSEGFVADAALHWGGNFGTLGMILEKQFALYANSIVALHNGDVSNVAVVDYAAVADLLSTDLMVGHYLVGQLILNNGLKNLLEHAQAGKYTITTPGSYLFMDEYGKFLKGVKDEIRRNSFFIKNPMYISPIFWDDANGSSSTVNPLLGWGERHIFRG